MAQRKKSKNNNEDIRRPYKGQYLEKIAFPLGGIGTGSIALTGHGALREWEIFNETNKNARLNNTFFAIRAQQEGGETVCKLLETPETHVAFGRRAPDLGLPRVREVEFTGEYPIAYVNYIDPDMPVSVELEAFTPFLPLDAKNSALPVAVFNFTVNNRSKKSVEVSLGAMLQNAVGYDGTTEIAGNRCGCFGGNANRSFNRKEFSGVHMTTKSLKPKDIRFGSMTLATTATDSSVAECIDVREFWSEFVAEGKLARHSGKPSTEGETHAGAIAIPMKLKGGESKTATIIIGWHFPNRRRSWCASPEQNEIVGNKYAEWFDDSREAVAYLVNDLDTFSGITRLFCETFYNTDLPYYMLDCISSQISTIRSTTCMWLADGTFAGFEGSSPGCGCCPMNCTHVWNYEHTLAWLFPELERNMRHSDFFEAMEENGLIHYRLPHLMPGRKKVGHTADGQFGTILKLYREFLLSGDRDFLTEMWPRAKKAMEYGILTWDPEEKGVLDGPQWNTYDLDFHGLNTYTGTFYLAALRAAERLAIIMGETDLAERYHAIFMSGRDIYDQELWNGEYYIQKYDAKKVKENQYGAGCLSDQLIGQWWARILGLGDLLPRTRVRRALRSIEKYNFREDFFNHAHFQRIYVSQDESGLLVTNWPDPDDRPESPMRYCDEVWTGIEYQVAAHLIYEGMVAKSLELVHAARSRYDGRRRNPWNEPECGNHYARAMSSWTLLLALSGAHYEAHRRSLEFHPRWPGSSFGSFFNTADGWGYISCSRKDEKYEMRLDVKYGSIDLEKVVLSGPIASGKNREMVAVNVRHKNRKVPARVEPHAGAWRVIMSHSVLVSAGESLRLVLS